MDAAAAFVPLLVASGAGAIILAVVNGFISRRQSGADATSVLTAAASQLVAATQAQSNAMAIRLGDVETEIAELRKMARANRLLLELHARWDEEVVHVLSRRGIEIAPPPPLYIENV